MDTKVIWLEVVRLALEGTKMNLDELHPELAKVVKDAEVLRLAFETVCKEYEVDPAIVLSACVAAIESKS